MNEVQLPQTIQSDGMYTRKSIYSPALSAVPRVNKAGNALSETSHTDALLIYQKVSHMIYAKSKITYAALQIISILSFHLWHQKKEVYTTYSVRQCILTSYSVLSPCVHMITLTSLLPK